MIGLPPPDFLPSPHGLNFPGLSVSVDLLKLSLLCFTRCDTVSEIMAAASSSSPEVFWVTTFVVLGYLISLLKPKLPKWIVTTDRVTSN